MQRKKRESRHRVKSSDTKKRTTSKIPSSFTRHTTHRPIIRYSSFREEDSKTTTFNRHAIFPPRLCARANALVSTMRASRVHTAALSVEKTRERAVPRYSS